MKFDYYPFGMEMSGRKYSGTSSYRYGFNGKENDNDVKGEGNQIAFEERIYDPRIGRFLSVDPIGYKFPWQSPFVFANNNPVSLIDYYGLGAGDPPTSTKEEGLKYLKENKGLKQSSYYQNIDPVKLMADIESNINDPDNSFQQGKGTDFCSKAAITNVFAKNDPKGYAKFILDLYQNGVATYNGVHVNPSKDARNASGTLEEDGLKDHPAAQMAFVALTTEYNKYVGHFKKGDENNPIVTGTMLSTFNSMAKDFLRYNIDSKGSTAGAGAYAQITTLSDGTSVIRYKSANEVVSELNRKLSQGIVFLFIDGPNTRGEGGGIGTHYVRLTNIEILSSPSNGRDIKYTRWDNGKTTDHYIGSTRLIESIMGVTVLKK